MFVSAAMFIYSRIASLCAVIDGLSGGIVGVVRAVCLRASKSCNFLTFCLSAFIISVSGISFFGDGCRIMSVCR